MLCQRCHKNLATARYAEVVDGKVSDLHLCAECMKKHRDAGVSGFELAGPQPSSRRQPIVRSTTDSSAIQRRTCKQCGASLRDVLKSGRVGCRYCYESFAEQLEPLLRGMHSSMIHRGKSPRMNDVRERLRTELQTKRALLRSALKLENYEEAALLRDQVKALEVSVGAVAVEQS